jgi:hypothetical protein
MIGPHVQEGRYDLMLTSGEVIIPSSLRAATIRPGDKITMRMWPQDRRPPMHMMHPRMMDPRIPFPSMRPGAGRPGSAPRVIPVGSTPKKKSKKTFTSSAFKIIGSRGSEQSQSDSDSEKDALGEEEDSELKVVDFEEEAEQEQGEVADMLSRFTNAKDTQGDWAKNMGVFSLDNSTDSDSSTSYTISSSDVLDD